MNIIALNGSPKAKESASGYVLKAMQDKLVPSHEVEWVESRLAKGEELANAIAKSEALLLVFPLYVDGIPGHLLAVLEEVEKELRGKNTNCRVYGIAQSGFYEAKQNRFAMEMLQIWSEKCGLHWGQGICYGAGGMVQFAPLGHGPSTNLGKAADTLLDNLQAGKPGETLFCEPNFPRFLYKAAAHMSWRKIGKENGLKPKDLYYKVGQEGE